MSRQFMNDGFRNAPEEKNGGRHVPKVVNPQLLDAGARTGSLERFSDIPDLHLLAGEVHVAAGLLYEIQRRLRWAIHQRICWFWL